MWSKSRRSGLNVIHIFLKKDHSGHVWRLGEKKARVRMHTGMEMAAFVQARGEGVMAHIYIGDEMKKKNLVNISYDPRDMAVSHQSQVFP